MTNDVWFKAQEINEVIEVGSRRLRAILNDMVLDGILEVDGQTKAKNIELKIRGFLNWKIDLNKTKNEANCFGY